jgi:hypothetical protein
MGDERPGGFTDFFKRYVNGWAAAAVVLPAAINWLGMPVYDSQRAILRTYTTLACVLTLALLFYSRDIFAARTLGRNRIAFYVLKLLPLALLGGAVFCGFRYVDLLKESFYYAQMEQEQALKTVTLVNIQNGTSIMVYYILTLLCAEAALFLMAFQEWMRGTR